MYHSEKASTGCITLSRNETNEGSAITDEEISYFKGIPFKKFSRLKEETRIAVQRLIVLRKYVEYIVSAEVEGRAATKSALALLKRRPFSIPELEITKKNIVPLLDPKHWRRFRQQFRYSELESFEHHALLDLRRSELKSIQRKLRLI